MNVGLLGKGNSSRPEALVEQIEAGACGLKVHEDWGATPATIDCALTVADEHDVQVALHADTLNESAYLADTIAAIDGRTIHSYHTEGAGGGHAPDVIAIASLPNVLPSSTNPTRPYTTDTTDNLFYMTVITHHLNPGNPEDIAFAQSRIRAETEAAEDVLHDLGVLSMYSSDSQAMGRIGDTVATCWRTADKMKKLTGSLAGDPAEHDNARILRYLAKLTINPALAHGIGHLVGSLEPGKVADIVLWPTNTFGVKPKIVVKGGLIAWAAMGDPNASVPTPEPVLLRPMFAARGTAVARTSITFVSQAASEGGVAGAAGPGALDRAGARMPHDRQGADGAQRRHAGDPRRPGDLPGHRRRQASHRRGRRRGGDVAALLHRLMSGAAGLRGLLAVLQLSDSAFPSGRYTLSHGLETFAQEGLLERPCPPARLAALLGDCIRFGVGPSDGVALACAHRAVAPTEASTWSWWHARTSGSAP